LLDPSPHNPDREAQLRFRVPSAPAWSRVPGDAPTGAVGSRMPRRGPRRSLIRTPYSGLNGLRVNSAGCPSRSRSDLYGSGHGGVIGICRVRVLRKPARNPSEMGENVSETGPGGTRGLRGGATRHCRRW
jgi:hypothetical protein